MRKEAPQVVLGEKSNLRGVLRIGVLYLHSAISLIRLNENRCFDRAVGAKDAQMELGHAVLHWNLGVLGGVQFPVGKKRMGIPSHQPKASFSIIRRLRTEAVVEFLSQRLMTRRNFLPRRLE